LLDLTDLPELRLLPSVKKYGMTSYINNEAGMQAVRKNRYVILNKDIEKGYKANVKKNETEHEFYR